MYSRFSWPANGLKYMAIPFFHFSWYDHAKYFLLYFTWSLPWTWQVWHVVLFIFCRDEGNCSYLRRSSPVSIITWIVYTQNKKRIIQKSRRANFMLALLLQVFISKNTLLKNYVQLLALLQGQIIWLSKGLFKIWSTGSFLSDKMVLFLFCVYIYLPLIAIPCVLQMSSSESRLSLIHN